MKISVSAVNQPFFSPIAVAITIVFPFDLSAATQASNGLVLNEILASNQVGLRDNNGERSDWLELWNSGSEHVQLKGYGLTDDLDEPDKWVFPNYQLAPGAHALVWMTGREGNAIVPGTLTSTEGTVAFATTYIEPGADWKFLHPVPGVDEPLPADWTTVNFEDREFQTGRAGFGYGDDDDATELPGGTTVVLLRRKFDLESLHQSEPLILQIDYDDGFVAFLNGQRILAVNAPGGELSFQSVATAGHDAGVPQLFDLSEHTELLRVGKNVFAIAGLNISNTSSDLSLNPVLGTLPPVCHADFKLSKEGGQLFLLSPDGKVVDQLEYPEQTSDVSLGRSTSQPDKWGYYIVPTPGRINLGHSGSQPFDPPLFSPEPGSFDKSIKITIRGPGSAQSEIRYTVDGNEPTEASPTYHESIEIIETTLVRAAVFSGPDRASQIVSATYLVEPNRPELPVLSLSMKPEDFRDVQLNARATGHASERTAFMEYFEPGGTRTFATGFGLRLHGGAGRDGPFERKKSYRMYFRKSYGVSRLDGRIIPEAGVEDFDKLVLRASSNDKATHGTSIRDQVVRDVHAEMGALASRGSWCVLLINGENRGVYNITERMDEEFYASHFGPGHYDVIKTGESVLNGTREGWDELRAFVENNDFTDDAMFAKLADRVDVENLTSYMVVNMALTNFDWPNNNWYAARRIPDGKWTFQCWDAEWALGYEFPWLDDAPYGVEVDPYAFIDSGGGYGGSLTRKLFLALLDNPGFRDRYQDEVRRYLAGPLSPENIMRHIHRHRDAIAHDMEAEYKSHGQGISRWYEQLKVVEHFAKNTPLYFQKWTDEYFSHRVKPDEQERLAMFEDSQGRRNVIYRDTHGILRHVRSLEDGDNWRQAPDLTIANIPHAAGPPSAYSLRSNDRRIVYRGKDDHIHELSRNESSDNTTWKHSNLTTQLKLPLASCDPSVVVVDGTPHIVYVGDDSRIRELWFSDSWQHHPLPASPKPGSGASITASAGTLHVTYRTMFDVPCEQRLELGSNNNGKRVWRHRLTQRIPSAGLPTGMNIDGNWRIVFRPTQGWSLREPFIFHFNNATRVGYREYNGPRNGVMQAWDQRGRFQHLEQIGSPDIPIAGNPSVVEDSQGNTSYILYRDADGHIRELSTNGSNNWRLENVSALAGAPPATSDPSGVTDSQTGPKYYTYRTANGSIIELSHDGNWTHRTIASITEPDRGK